MAADTFSALLGFLSMVTGNDPNTWGSNCNTGVFQIFEDAIAGVLTSSVTGGTLDLSGSPPPAAASQARYSRLVFTGVLSANQTVIVPNLPKAWLVENQTSGGFNLYLKTTSGTATQIPSGTMKVVRCDGANGMTRLDSNDIGLIEVCATPSVPNGFLACSGIALTRTNWPDLFAKIGTTWGLGSGGDGTTFGLPNLTDTGRFLRSSGGSSVGTYQANQNSSHTHTGQATGTTDATTTDHTHTYSGTTGNDSPDHTHGINTGSSATTGSVVAGGSNFNGVQATGGASARHAHSYSGTTSGFSANHTHTFTSGGFTTSATGGSEARPEAAVVLMCIRY